MSKTNLEMPFGKHKGKNVEDVPDSYLLWAYETLDLFGDIKDYIETNLDSIKINAKVENEEFLAKKAAEA